MEKNTQFVGQSFAFLDAVEQAGRAAMGLAGSLVVGAGGMMAIYAMYAAMRQAKVEGDIKREAQRAGRKAQREAIHSHDEHLGVEDFLDGVAWYRLLIERLPA